MIVQRDERTLPRRSTSVPRRSAIMQRGKAIVQRAKTIVPRHEVYRLLRVVDRDGCAGEAIARFADANACAPEAIARLANPLTRSTRSERIERTRRTRALRIVRRERTIRRVELGIAPTESRIRPREWTMVRGSSAIVRYDELISRPAYRIVPDAKIIRHDGARHRLALEGDATGSCP